MALPQQMFVDGEGNEITAEEAQKLYEESQDEDEQPICQQETHQEKEVKTLRASRKPHQATVTPQAKPPVKERVTEALPFRQSWLKENGLYLGLGMVFMTALYIVCMSYVYPAYVSFTDRLQCGENLICHSDIAVGHNGTSHFIAEYWHNQAVVTEIPQNHPELTKTYTLHMPAGEDIPRMVSLHPAYINMHGKPGYPDLEVYVDGFTLPAILYNTGTAFSEEQPS